jgi:hypothetical protein
MARHSGPSTQVLMILSFQCSVPVGCRASLSLSVHCQLHSFWFGMGV